MGKFELKIRIWDGKTMHHDVEKWSDREFWNELGSESLSEAMKKHAASFYTGCSDKNDKQVFEGDILRVHHWQENIDFIAQVACNDNEWFLQDASGKAVEFWDDGNHSWFVLSAFAIEEEGEIIGNVFENPELLK